MSPAGFTLEPISIPDTTAGRALADLRRHIPALRRWRRLALHAQTESSEFSELAEALAAIEEFLNLGLCLERVAVGERHVTAAEAAHYPGSSTVRYYAVVK